MSTFPLAKLLLWLGLACCLLSLAALGDRAGAMTDPQIDSAPRDGVLGRAAAQTAATPGTAATPSAAATPAAAGCGSQASSPIEIAEVFLAAATADDLERATGCFAPDSRPTGWDEVFLGGTADGWDDVTGCRGLPYVVRESTIRAGFSAIIFTFDDACAVAQLDRWQREIFDAATLDVRTVIVQVYQADDRWYVLNAFPLVAD